MKKLTFSWFFMFFLLFYSCSTTNNNASVFTRGSRQYRPSSPMEESWYVNINKSIWPNDVRENIEVHLNTLIGWVGIVEKYMTDEKNDEYNTIGFYIRHHYYNWIEDFSSENKPIKLSPDGEGYFVCYYYARKEVNINELIEDVIGNCIIFYGYPVKIDNEDGVITLSTGYFRFISKIYVNSNWLRYGREGF